MNPTETQFNNKTEDSQKRHSPQAVAGMKRYIDSKIKKVQQEKKNPPVVLE